MKRSQDLITPENDSQIFTVLRDDLPQFTIFPPQSCHTKVRGCSGHMGELANIKETAKNRNNEKHRAPTTTPQRLQQPH